MQEIAAQRYDPSAAQAVLAWRQLLDDLQQGGHSVEDRLARVNAFFNARIRFDDDIAVWRTADYWATPLETLARAAGDCEDFAIAKYMTLRLLGVDDSRLRLIYVRARIGGPGSQVSQAHMVLGYYPEPSAEPLILDNLIRDVRPAARRPDLFPVFSFNADGLWVAGARQSSADPGTRLSRWRDVLDRAHAEGLALPGRQP
ncbi:transglutaminase-like cysteine peptidase [Thauera linaloolentis]|uniref:Transglutaminase n=1 Tax=Thauera linaloolentis (strain DSM 12138 / JCM 21573 / CCUG 41526 / CIP 105981 / IAM 15112 / NBRC 102519 / 47Lol) TaxID=1123367 RepID=N6Z7Z0_THAL4|nr:transglutaminase-like cysteine peptidase [Thauera linaloolentis]ENO90712.1 hypothetical protein C666_00760 [Thauera linaloolentis 47Lol = DSM 12138]MCM8565620.1 transglutaminase-like cysteine peptidase [Thauera linaloolentis]